MQNAIPSMDEVRQLLAVFTRADLLQIADKSGTPFHTLLKIKRGETLNPAWETVRRVLPFIALKRRKPSTTEQG